MMRNKELTLTEVKELLKIDKHNLDAVVIEQASLYEEVGDAYVMSISRRDLAKEALADMDAIISDDFRTEAANTGEKITEKALSNKVLQDSGHQESFGTYSQLKLEADRWGVLKESFAQRASMVKYICDLQFSNYFTRESIKGNASTAEIKDQSRQDMIKEKNEKSPRKRATR